MSSEIKSDDDDPPFVLQNCSALSRQAAMSTTTQKTKRGWGLGWLGGGVNNNVDKSKSGRSASTAMHKRKMEKIDTTTDSSISSHKVNKSMLPAATPSISSSIIKSKRGFNNASTKQNEKKADKTAAIIDSASSGQAGSSSDADAEPTTLMKSRLHPPSPRSLSPRYPSSNLNMTITETEASDEQMSKTEAAKNVDANGIPNEGVSSDELSRQKRREEIRQKTAWYEEYIQDHLSKHDGNLSSLNKEELVAMGLFDKQRRLNRRLRLWGQGDPEAEQGLSDGELEQLLILAEKCNQSQNDEAELEMLLVQIENNNEVDMDRLYHLELLSRQRQGEILNPEELNALQIFEEKKQVKDDLEALRSKQKAGTRDVDEKLLRELTLLERKRNGDETMTIAELRSAEIIEMRHEDVRLNKQDYGRLLRLKEQGIHVDEDRFNLLRLLDLQRNGVDVTGSEAEILEHYFELREEEYLQRYEAKESANWKESHEKIVPVNEDKVQKSDCTVLPDKEEHTPENSKPKIDDETIDKEKEGISDTCNKESDSEEKAVLTVKTDNIHELEFDDDVVGDELLGEDKAGETPTNSEVEGNDEIIVPSTFDEEPFSLPDNEVLKKFHLELEKEGLPSMVSFTLNCEDDELNMSTVSFSDATYINDILLQKERRESDREEECLEEAYKVYKRKMKKEKLPESEELLLAIFAKTLQQRNTEMHDEDIKFNELVERVESLNKMRQEEAKSLAIENKVLNYMVGQSETPQYGESMKPHVREAAEQKQKVIGNHAEAKEKSTEEKMTDLAANVAEENTGLPQSLSRQLERSESNRTDCDDSSVEKSETFGDESRLLQQFVEEKIEPVDERLVEFENQEQMDTAQGEEMLQEDKKTQPINIIGSLDRENEKGRTKDEEEILKSTERAAEDSRQTVSDNVDGEGKNCNEFPQMQNVLGQTYADLIDQSPVGKAVKKYLMANEYETDESHDDVARKSVPFESLPFEVMDEEDTSDEKETSNLEKITIGDAGVRAQTADTSSMFLKAEQKAEHSSVVDSNVLENEKSCDSHDSKVEESFVENEVLAQPKKAPSDTENENLPDSGTEENNLQGEERNPLVRSDIGGVEIKLDLLYELNLITRLRKGLHLTDKQDYELELLQAVRRGHTLSKEENEDLELLRSERGQITLNDTYMRDLYFRSSRNQSVNDDLVHEIELFHKQLSGAFMSDDEKMELYLFGRRLNGDLLQEDDMEVLEFLKRERLELLMIDQSSDGTKELSVSEESNDHPVYHTNGREIERTSSRGSSQFSDDSPTQSVGRRELSVEDEDSLYRRDLLGRQMAGQRLDKKEFQWLQILTKKNRDEELDENDLEELELMRNQRNEKEVNIVNTKKLLEKELKRKNRIRMKEERRKEKEERREQRRREKEERELLKKRRKRKKRAVSSERDKTHKSQPDSNDEIDASYSHHGQTEVQIIGAPSLQPSQPEEDKKDEPKMGVFGAVFKNAQKQRQEQQLEEARRLQEQLIREQMKALALENEAEELEREKVMQEQLVQETIEKKKASSTVGSSFASSIGSSSWESSSAEDFFEDSDSSSWTSWDTSSDDDSSHFDEEIQENEKESGEKVDQGGIVQQADLSGIKTNEVESELSAVNANTADLSKVQNSTNKELLQTNMDGESDAIPIRKSYGVRIDHASNHSTDSQRAGDVGERQTKSNAKGSLQRGSLGTHLKKRKKKRTKHGDDVSLGTMQLAKVVKEGRKSKSTVDKAGKSKVRPWMVNESIDNSIDEDGEEISQNGDDGNQDEKSTNDAPSLDFNPSFVSRTSENDEEDEQKSESVVHSGTEDERDADTEEKASVREAHSIMGSVANSYRSGSLANSYRSFGEEKYDLGLDEYDNIESRLGGKVKDKQAEFDLTWETAVADEDVIIQINQRLRERQREMDAKREKKKEKNEKVLKQVPRLFLFEGERVAKKSKKKNARRKHERKLKRKLNRTFTPEFRKAMKEVFDSESYSDDEYSYKTDMSEKRHGSFSSSQIQDNVEAPPFFRERKEDFDDDASDPLIYSDGDDEFAEDVPKSRIDESVKFDGDYLRRLQERSLPTDMKKMLSGRSMTSKSSKNSKKNRSKRNLGNSPDDPSYVASHIDRRRPRRKKTGEIVNPNIDPADIYAQELAKQKEEKAFTITNIRKEMEGIGRTQDFIDEGNTNFGNFDAMAPSPLIQTNVNVRKMKKKISLAKGVESLERQRPKLPGMRSLRSLGTTTSDQGLLTGNRRKLKDTNGDTGTSNVQDGIQNRERRGVLRTSSDSFGVSGSENEKSEANGILNNMNLFGAIKKTFKQKPVQFESIDGGGLLNAAHIDELDTSESKGGDGITDDSYTRSAFTRQEPLPLPPLDEDDEMQQQRANKMFQKVKIKGVIKKLKQLPGKSSQHRKFDGGIMMAD